MIGNKLIGLFSSATLMLLSGCNATQEQQGLQALLASPNTSTREVLEQHIGNFFNSQPVKLADNVFTSSSTVLIEREHISGARPSTPSGLGQVDSFTLILIDNRCLLEHDQSKKRIELPTINCKAG